ncbi:Xenobiotic-transporting ATPase [Clostridium sp. DL-VIII]|uniref:ABC transporter ATP-binding protein n=1 Tax=Clostridium sp. DL-VIII TaxID=641107 RepID=UPI00023B089E|nr:ABC transporter ATP-binding protein [Clostridium sp. DL-VIII]EHJ01702.1 Xenobiotic-transporting ATPase [Clostridium sp. DL-VIII]
MNTDWITNKKNIVIKILSLSALAIISSLALNILPILSRMIIDNGFLKNDVAIIYRCVVFILILNILKSLANLWINISIKSLGISVAENLKKKVVLKVFNSPLNFFDKISNGELSQRINEVDSISSLFTPQLTNIIVSIISSIFAIIMSIRISLSFVIIYILAFPIIAVASYRFSKKYKAETIELINLQTKSNQVMLESISGINEVKGFNLSSLKLNQINNINKEIYLKERRQNTFFSINSEMLTLINVLVTVSITIIFTVLFSNEKVSLGQYLEITQYTSLALTPAQLASMIYTLYQPASILKKRLEFFNSVQQQDILEGESLKLIDSIEFKSVSFSYENKKVLNNLSFKVNKSNKFLICGPNGSGKTTITKLLLRFYDNIQGLIIFNNQDYRRYSIESIRKQIAIVFQDTFLFNGSLYDNIACGNDDITDYDIKEAIEKTGLLDNLNIKSYDDLLSLPILEGGKNLSGGQKKMISLVRTLVRKPSVIILDEPTTFLDSKAKKDIINYIAKEHSEILIVISHDEDLFQYLDKKIQLGNK